MGISVVYTDMPITVRSFVKHDVDWDTIVINARLDHDTQKRCLRHEIRHIRRNDFAGEYVDGIEAEAHK